jgi:hypothetical protein
MAVAFRAHFKSNDLNDLKKKNKIMVQELYENFNEKNIEKENGEFFI